MESLLDQVIQATIARDEGKYPLRITNNDDFFLFIKEGSESLEKGYPAPEPSLLEKFILDKNTEVFERFKVLFSQSKLLFFKDGFKWTSVEKKEKRVKSIIKSYKLNEHNGSITFLTAKLLSDDPEDVRAAVFVLGSIDDPDVTRHLLLSLSKAPDELLPSYSEGLKHCISDKISGQIAGILPSVHKNIKDVCHDILLYRMDYSLPELIESEDKEFKEKTALLKYTQKNVKTVIDLSDFDSLESLFRRMISDKANTIEYIVNTEITADNIFLYAVSGSRDFNFLKDSFDKSEEESVKKAVIVACGITGSKESLSFLIEKLSDYKETVEKALFMALGEAPEDGSSESWKKIIQKKIQSTERVRKGFLWNEENLLNEIKNPLSRAFDRKTAWRELMIKKGDFIPFEPDWLTDKQHTAIKRIEKCLR